MGRWWRRIHYHPRHLLDYKQVANTDNAAGLPVFLMEKFTNEDGQGNLSQVQKFVGTTFIWLFYNAQDDYLGIFFIESNLKLIIHNIIN